MAKSGVCSQTYIVHVHLSKVFLSSPKMSCFVTGNINFIGNLSFDVLLFWLMCFLESSKGGNLLFLKYFLLEYYIYLVCSNTMCVCVYLPGRDCFLENCFAIVYYSGVDFSWQIYTVLLQTKFVLIPHHAMPQIILM